MKYLKSLIFVAILLGAPMFGSVSNPQTAYAQGHGRGMIGLGAKDAAGGIQVFVVIPGGPAERAGVRIGDVITAVNGASVPNATAMTDAVKALAPEQKARLSILRGGRRMTISVMIGEAVGDDSPAPAPAANAGPVKPVRPISVSGYTTFTDPLETAFTMQIPQGWHTVGGMARRAALQINAFLRTVSPDKMTYLIVGEPTLTGYVPPAPWRTAAGYPEGKLFDNGLSGLTMVLRYKNGGDYARLYGQSTLQSLCLNLRYVGGSDRADMAANADKLVPSAFPAVSSGGEARFRCTHGGQPMEARMEVVTRTARDNTMWNVIFLKGFIAPQSQADKAQEILDRVGGSFQYIAAWSRKQSALDAAAAAQINRNLKHYFQQEQPIIRSMNQADESFSAMDDIVSGYSTYRDATTGYDYKLSNTNPYKWQDPSTGRIVSTPEKTPPAWGNYQPMPRV